MGQTLNVERAVQEKYSVGAQRKEAALCCPVEYDPKRLEILPQELIERDYGCGDPTRFLREREVVLDLGCGTGKVCSLASQTVGPTGQVIGVDMNREMLTLELVRLLRRFNDFHDVQIDILFPS